MVHNWTFEYSSESIEVSQNHGILLESTLLHSHNEEYYNQKDNFGKMTCNPLINPLINNPLSQKHEFLFHKA